MNHFGQKGGTGKCGSHGASTNGGGFKVRNDFFNGERTENERSGEKQKEMRAEPTDVFRERRSAQFLHTAADAVEEKEEKRGKGRRKDRRRERGRCEREEVR